MILFYISIFVSTQIMILFDPGVSIIAILHINNDIKYCFSL